MFSIVVLLSGAGTNLQAIIEQIESGNINAKISAVISNRADAYGLKRAENAGITNLFLDHASFLDRESFDQSLAQIIDSYSPDLIVLAGFMRILSDEFVDQFEGKPGTGGNITGEIICTAGFMCLSQRCKHDRLYQFR